jgi:cytochrome c oxidase subunit 2
MCQRKERTVNKLKIMLIAFTVFTAASRSTMAQNANGAAPQTVVVHEIQVTAKRYDFTPGLLRVKKGEEVRLIIAALDHDHGFKLDEFHINQKIKRGATATVEFRPDKAGTFQFRCSNFCGLGHGGMKGTLVVEE